MRVVNRAALVVRPKQPYLAWAAGLDPDGSENAQGLSDKVSVYLVPEDMSESEETPPLELFFKEVFELELEAWWQDKSAWPPIRDYATFCEWFEVTGESMVVDLAHGPIAVEVL